MDIWVRYLFYDMIRERLLQLYHGVSLRLQFHSRDGGGVRV